MIITVVQRNKILLSCIYPRFTVVVTSNDPVSPASTTTSSGLDLSLFGWITPNQ